MCLMYCSIFFFFNDTATTEIYTLSLHDALPISPLDIGEVSRIHFRGGSHIGISRANPTKDPKHLDNAVLALLRLNVSQLITIGGDDTGYFPMELEEKGAGRLQGGHVPKTIDNELDPPPPLDTFGF